MPSDKPEILYPRIRDTRQLRKRVSYDDGSGFKTVPDGIEEFYYEVTLDQKGLRQLAIKAANNATLRAKDGPLVVRILARRRI